MRKEWGRDGVRRWEGRKVRKGGRERGRGEWNGDRQAGRGASARGSAGFACSVAARQQQRAVAAARVGDVRAPCAVARRGK
jgi:hypothetical protein